MFGAITILALSVGVLLVTNYIEKEARKQFETESKKRVS